MRCKMCNKECLDSKLDNGICMECQDMNNTDNSYLPYKNDRKFNEKEIFESIKKSYLHDCITSLIGVLIFSFGVVISLSCLLYALIEKQESSIIDFIIMIFFFGCSVTFLIILLKSLIKDIHLYRFPLESNVYQLYGNIIEVLKEVNQTVEYEDKKIIISENYVLSKTDYRQIFALKDILHVYKKVNKRNFIIESYEVVITTKYNDISYFKYAENEEEIVDNIIKLLSLKCRNSVFGYTSENLKYVKNNIIERTRLNQ